jgi:RNA polymerase sigma-70 factor (ECF subfamily)
MDSLSEQFGQIYDQYIDKIYRFVYLKVSSQEIAEDITSKVFIRGWEAFQEQKAGISNPGAFLYQIARNAVIDHYREKGRTNTISTDLAPEVVDSGISAQDKAILSADVHIVKKAIKGLKKDYQDIIIWYYLEDIPVATIAQMVDKPAGTVRVMLHRGLSDLRDIIQQA